MIADDLYTAHYCRVAYYDSPDISDFVVGWTGQPPIFSSLMLSWRGILADPSAFAWEQLDLSQHALKLLVVQAVEGSGKIYR